jgi:glycosyltransferase involved in cell wall biosynthesis
VRITYLHPELDFSDGTARLYESVSAARTAGHEVSVIARRAERTGPLVAAGAACYEGELPARMLTGAFAVRRARHQVAELAPDLLHVTDTSLGDLAARLAEALATPYVLEVVRPFDRTLRIAPSWLRAVILPCATFFESAVNRGGVPRNLLHVIEHGPKLEHALTPQRDFDQRRPVLLSVGTLDRDHGADVLVECARLLKAEGRKLSTLILGEGPEEQRLRRSIRELGLANSVSITAPMLADLDLALSQADLHVACARRGNPGWSAVRALGMGVPSIFTAISSTFPLIEDRVDGLLVERNDPRKLAEAVRTLLDNPAAATSMGDKARENLMAQDRASTYRRVLDEVYTTALGIGVG